jgi:hypothetical protein
LNLGAGVFPRLGNGLGRAQGILGGINGILGAFRAEGEEGEAALFDEEEVAAALADLNDDELTALEQELALEEENLALLVEEEAAAALAEEEGLALALEDEAALELAMAVDPSVQQQPTASSTTSSSASTPTWAIGLVVLGVLVAIALSIVQIQLIMLFRKRLPNAVVDRV